MMRQSRIGSTSIAVTETGQHYRLSAVALKIVAEHAGLPGYDLATIEVRLRRDGAEFPDGRMLTPEVAARLVAELKDFLDRNYVPEQQPVAASPKPSETAAANNV